MRLSPRLVCRSTGSTFDASDQVNEGRIKRRLQRPPLTVGSLVTLTGKSFLGRGPGVPCLRKTSSFLARVLFEGPCARISGSGSPGSSDAAGAPGIRRENNMGLRTHVLGAPSVRAVKGSLVGTPCRGKHLPASDGFPKGGVGAQWFSYGPSAPGALLRSPRGTPALLRSLSAETVLVRSLLLTAVLIRSLAVSNALGSGEGSANSRSPQGMRSSRSNSRNPTASLRSLF